MVNKLYRTPIVFLVDEGEGSETGNGSGQGTNFAEGMTYDEWWEVIAKKGTNPDADYNGDNVVNIDDYNYYIENELWNG